MARSEIEDVALTERLFGMMVGSLAILLIIVFVPEEGRYYSAVGLCTALILMSIWNLLGHANRIVD